MKAKQNLKILQNQAKCQNKDDKKGASSPSKSFRSKLFEQRAKRLIPKINDKQITMHLPPYQKYLEQQFKLSDINKVPQIWGCLIPPQRKPLPTRKNYLKRDIDSPKNIFRSYMKRKSKLLFGIPITKEFTQSDPQQKSQQIQNPEQQQINQEQVSQFFTEIRFMSQTAREKIKRYEDEEHEEIKSSKLFGTKPTTGYQTSRLTQRLSKRQGFLKSQQMRRINNKSVYQMSLQELRQSIIWKKHLLQCLNESVKSAKSDKLR